MRVCERCSHKITDPTDYIIRIECTWPRVALLATWISLEILTLLTLMCHFRLVIFVMASERTFIMIKPDGVHRGIVGEIIKRFENKGFKLVAMKFMQVR